jgi:ATP-binding protein involved in chromosome partitioning
MSGVFGRGAGRAVASELDVAFLGEIPFDDAIVDEGDRGVPTMVGRSTSPTGVAFDRIAECVATRLGWHRAS